MNWFTAIVGLVVGAVVSGGVVGMSMLARETIVVAGARKAATEAGIVACNSRVGQIEAAHSQAVEEAVRAATQAASTVVDPAAKASLIELCRASASCRDRKRL